MSAYPPPLPSPDTESEPSQFATHGANTCLAAPFIVIALCMTFSSTFQNHHDPSGRPLAIVIGFLSIGLVALGCLMGLLALVLAKSSQRVSVIVRVACGYVLVGLLTAIAVPNYVRARNVALQNQQALADVHTAAQDYRALAVAALTNSQFQPANSEQLQRSLGLAADKTTGETAAILRASQLYLQHMQAAQHSYEIATSALFASKVLSAANLEQRDQIQERKALVLKFLSANKELKAFVQQGEANYRKDLDAFAISPVQKEAAMTGFRRNYAVQSPFLVAVRDSDERMGRAMLGILNLFDAQWGRWSYDINSRRIRFEDTIAVSQYNDFMADIKKAGIDQAAAQQRLAAAVSRSEQAN